MFGSFLKNKISSSKKLMYFCKFSKFLFNETSNTFKKLQEISEKIDNNFKRNEKIYKKIEKPQEYYHSKNELKEFNISHLISQENNIKKKFNNFYDDYSNKEFNNTKTKLWNKESEIFIEDKKNEDAINENKNEIDQDKDDERDLNAVTIKNDVRNLSERFSAFDDENLENDFSQNESIIKYNEIKKKFKKKFKIENILDQSYDLEKCEIIDMDDKNTHEIVNLIFSEEYNENFMKYISCLSEGITNIEKEKNKKRSDKVSKEIRHVNNLEDKSNPNKENYLENEESNSLVEENLKFPIKKISDKSEQKKIKVEKKEKKIKESISTKENKKNPIKNKMKLTMLNNKSNLPNSENNQDEEESTEESNPEIFLDNVKFQNIMKRFSIQSHKQTIDKNFEEIYDKFYEKLYESKKFNTKEERMEYILKNIILSKGHNRTIFYFFRKKIFNFSSHLNGLIIKIGKSTQEINIFSSFKYSKKKKQGFLVYYLFSHENHIGNILINFGSLKNCAFLESLAVLLNIFLIEIINHELKEKIIKYNFYSDKGIDFNKFINKKITNDKDINHYNINREIIFAKLSNFIILPEKKSPKLKLIVPNINFIKTTALKKSFAKYLKFAEDQEDGSIIYEIQSIKI